jgi:hypothetical protein
MNPKYREQRLACAVYNAALAEIVDFLASAVMNSPPSIITGEGAPDESKDYWHGLNLDADGCGGSLRDLAAKACLQLLVQKKCFVSVVFPEPAGTEKPPNLESQKAVGELDGHLDLLSVLDVDDHEHDEEGRLLWIRTHCVDPVRKDMFNSPTMEKHSWTYVTGEWIATYEAEREAGGRAKPQQWQQGMMAKRSHFVKHDLGEIPVIETELPIWVAERLAPLAIALFNAEAALTFSLETSAYAMPVLFTDKQGNMVASELMALKLSPNDKASFLEPTGAHLAALDKQCEKLKTDLYGAVQALSLQTPSKASGPRQSGKAKFADYQALSVLVAMISSTLREGFQHAVDMIARIREEEIMPIVAGLDDTEVLSPQSKTELAAAYLALPGIPDAARRWVMLSASIDACNGAPADIIETIREQAMKDPIPLPPGAVNQDADPNSPTTVATGKPGELRDTPGEVRIDAKLKNIDPSKALAQHDVDKKFAGKLTDSMKKDGYDKTKPILAVNLPIGGHIVLDGHHRSYAAGEAGISKIPAWTIEHEQLAALLNAKFGGGMPKKASELDRFVYVEGKPYSAREDNDHANGTGPLSGPASQ